MQEVTHTLPPVFDAQCRILILGTMPSPRSRQAGFYYGHPANRFWRVLSAVLGEDAPDDPPGKTRWLLRHHIALWDVLQSCRIEGASDGSIRDPVPNAILPLLGQAPIQQVFTTGQTACRLYARLLGGQSVCLPSPSPANCAVPWDRLVAAYRAILPFLQDAEGDDSTRESHPRIP